MIRVLKGSGGYDVAYRIDGNSILVGNSGYDVAYRIDGDRILKGNSGYDVAYRIDGDRILEGNSGYDVAYRIDGNSILVGNSGYDVVFRLDQDSEDQSNSSSEDEDNGIGYHGLSSILNEKTPEAATKKLGCLGIVGTLFRFFWKSNLGGKIGVIIGAVGGASTLFGSNPGNAILNIPMGIIVFGGIGALIGKIVIFIRGRGTSKGKN